MDDSFFTGYRKTILRPQEILLSILIPYSKKVETITCDVYSLLWDPKHALTEKMNCYHLMEITTVSLKHPLCSSQPEASSVLQSV